RLEENWVMGFRRVILDKGVSLVPDCSLSLRSCLQEAQCAYAIILMALLWCTEALPLAVTAFFPLILFPMMSIMEASEVCVEYLKDTNILFIGGLLMAITVEKWNLHKRIALRVLLIIGVRPALLILGFMIVTAFLSMWISNTATTAMMVPIAHAVLEQLHKSPEQKDVEAGSNNMAFELQEPNGTIVTKETPQLGEKGRGSLGQRPLPKLPEENEQKKREHLRFSQGMSLCVCYAASIGGIATLTGTTPNLVLQGQVNSLFPDNPNVVNFASWFGFAFPTVIILLLLSWVWLQILFLGFNFRKNFNCGGKGREQERAAYLIIQNEHKSLGPMSFAEGAVTLLFFLLVALWFTREPGFFKGWGNVAFPNKRGEREHVIQGSLNDPASLLGVPDAQGKLKAPPALLDWNTVNKKMPWNIVFLLGGGFALAKGSEKSGLSKWLGDKLTPLSSIPSPAVAFILSLLVATFTECTSNVATTTLFLPILAQAICLNPLYVMLPCTMAASLAFMLPVATPPNAIVFSFGKLKVCDMAKAGFLLNIIGVLTISLAINTWAYPIFKLDQFPSPLISFTLPFF
uniref:Solute carrier family 13 member 2 n=1 Tax=Sarcophilus harrisii TaxID=9305 RepID=G3WJP3_SARHA